jgi:hypothetical protein
VPVTPGVAVIQPPTDDSHQNGTAAFERVNRWFKKADVLTVAPDAVDEERVGSTVSSEPG